MHTHKKSQGHKRCCTVTKNDRCNILYVFKTFFLQASTFQRLNKLPLATKNSWENNLLWPISFHDKYA